MTPARTATLANALASAIDGVIVRGPAASNATLIALIKMGATASQADWSANGRQVAMVTLNPAGLELAALARQLEET